MDYWLEDVGSKKSTHGHKSQGVSHIHIDSLFVTLFGFCCCYFKVRFHKPSINFGFAFKNSWWEGLLERRFSSWALAVLREDLSGFPAPSCWLTTFCNSSSRRIIPSSAWGINTHAGQTPIHIDAGRGERNLWWGLTLWIRLAWNYLSSLVLNLQQSWFSLPSVKITCTHHHAQLPSACFCYILIINCLQFHSLPTVI